MSKVDPEDRPLMALNGATSATDDVAPLFFFYASKGHFVLCYLRETRFRQLSLMVSRS